VSINIKRLQDGVAPRGVSKIYIAALDEENGAQLGAGCLRYRACQHGERAPCRAARCCRTHNGALARVNMVEASHQMGR